MAVSRHIYRRGECYWYRHTFRIAAKRRIDVRFSLQVSSRFVAKRLAVIIDAASAEIVSTEGGVLGFFQRKIKDAGSNPPPTDSDLNAMVMAYLKEVHRQKFGEYASYNGDNWHNDNHIKFVTDFDVYDMIVRTGTTRSSVNHFAIDQCEEEWREKGYSEDRIARGKAAFLANYQRGKRFPISEVERNRLIALMGRDLGPADIDRVEKLMCEVKREISWQVERRRQKISRELYRTDVAEGFPSAERPYKLNPLYFGDLGAPDSQEQAGTSETAPQPIGTASCDQRGAQAQRSWWRSDLSASDRKFSLNPVAFRPASVSSSDAGAGQHVAPVQKPELPSVSWAALVDEYVQSIIRLHGRCRTEDQIRTVGKIMAHVLGDAETLTSEISQTNLGDFVRTLRLLPKRWGKTKDELENGIAASLALGARLPADQRGVSAVTESKHLTHLKMLIKFGQNHGLGIGPALNIDGLKAERAKELAKQKADRGRENWSVEEVFALLNTPPYAGCKGPKRCERYLPGLEFYHDSAYWMPLILILSGMRSGEGSGFRLVDVKIDAKVPYFEIVDHGERSLKTETSRRQVPIHPELLRLGFADYVRALLAAGEEYLFPELRPQTKRVTWAANYYKSFKQHRNAAFPNGTNSAEVIGKVSYDKDVHSLRGTVITILVQQSNAKIVEGIVGHSDISSANGGNEAVQIIKITKRYMTPALLTERLAAMQCLTFLTAHLQPMPVVLNSFRPNVCKRRTPEAGGDDEPEEN